MIRHVPQHQRTYVTYIVSYMILANFAIETSLTYTLLISGVPIKHLQKTFGEKSMLDFEQHINLLIDCEQDVIRHSHASLDIDVMNRPVVIANLLCNRDKSNLHPFNKWRPYKAPTKDFWRKEHVRL